MQMGKRMASSAVLLFQRNFEQDYCAHAWGRPHLELTAKQSRPLPHARQPEATAREQRASLIGRESTAIVFDRQDYISIRRFTRTFTSVACACFRMLPSDSGTMR